MRVPAGLWVQLALCAASLVFIFTCPGNAMRTENDVASFYMNFPMLSVLQKVEIGVSGVVHASVLGRELLFFVLAVLAAALVWAKRREWLLRAVSLMPCVLMVPLSLYQYELGAVVPWVKQMAAAYTAAGYISLANCNAPGGPMCRFCSAMGCMPPYCGAFTPPRGRPAQCACAGRCWR